MNSKTCQLPVTLILILFLLVPCSPQNEVCYVSCARASCLPSGPLQCTSCDPGLIPINNECLPTGGQSQPLRRYRAVSENQLEENGMDPAKLVTCTINNGNLQQPNITFYNSTTSQAKYITEPLTFDIPVHHEYVQIKFNALLFNLRSDPEITLTVVNSEGINELNQVIVTDQSEYPISCSGATTSSPFFVNRKLSSSDSSLTLEIQTRREGDQLGIANFEVYYGNCHSSCSSCFGPTSSECQGCTGLLRFNNITKSCERCPDNFYRVGDICFACPAKCRTCQLNEKGTVDCLSCETTLQTAPVSPPNCSLQIQTKQSLSSLTFTDRDQWRSTEVDTDVLSTCSHYSLVGGIPRGLGGSSLYRTFKQLKIHKKVWIKFTVLLIDQEVNTNYNITVTVDGESKTSLILVNENEQSNNECGTNAIEFAAVVYLPNFTHESDTAEVSISGESNYFGIRDFTLGLENLTDIENCYAVDEFDNCSLCNYAFSLSETKTTCDTCADGYYLLDGQCQICPIFCKTCMYDGTMPVCTSCDKPLNQNKEKNECSDDDGVMYTRQIFSNLDKIVNSKWVLYPKLQTKGKDKCGNEVILGSTELLYRSLKMERKFTGLPSHRGVSVHFILYEIDEYDDFANSDNNIYGVYFKLDSKEYPHTPSKIRKQVCGNSSLDGVTKVILNDDSHTGSTLTIGVHANRTKVGINNILVFLKQCSDCSNTVSYELETIPVYSINAQPLKGLKVKTIFNEKIKSVSNISNLINYELIEQEEKVGQGTGLQSQLNLLQTELISRRELVQIRSLVKNHLNDSIRSIILKPGSIYTEKGDINKPLSSKSEEVFFARYDEINENDSDPRSNMRNLQNLFRGISILAMFIGLASFFAGLSSAFDDLFILCQVIFVHIFIQSPYNPITFKVPVSGMQVVQFMLWLPIEGRQGVESGIIPSNHYQRSPIVYEQYFEDVTFARTIYHTIIFFFVMFVFYWIVWICIRGFNDEKKKKRFITKYYEKQNSQTFTFIDKVVRFGYFTIAWASTLQFTWFQNEPQSFHIWNSVLLIVFFIFVLLYPIIGFIYIYRRFDSMSRQTFHPLYFGLRIEGGRKFFFFIFQYYKLLTFALLIGLLYNANPLAVLIPLIIIHLAEAILIIVVRPFYQEYPIEKIGTFFTKQYLTYYWISHVIQDFLFIILEILMIALYGGRVTDSTQTYLGIGYACCAFIALLLFNGLIRLAWTLVQIFEECYDDIKAEAAKIESVDENSPLKEAQGPLAMPTTVRIPASNVRPSFEYN